MSDESGIYFDTRSGVVGTPLGEIHTLSKMEADIIYVLWEAQGRPVKMTELVARIYGKLAVNMPEGEWRATVVVVSRLRRKIKDIGLHLRSGYGAGYALSYDPDKPFSPAHRPPRNNLHRL